MRRELTVIVNDRVRIELGVRDIIAGSLANTIVEENTDLVDELGHELAVKEIANMVRQACKASAEHETAPLFPWLDNELPRAIAVPMAGGKCRYVGLSRATVSDLSNAIDYLTGQITADTTRRDALSGVLRSCLDRGAPMDAPIIEVLRPGDAA